MLEEAPKEFPEQHPNHTPFALHFSSATLIDMLQHVLLYVLAFFGIWIGAGIAISSVERLSRRLRLSSFIVSFLILGFFTSISEFSVGINAVLDNDPGIFVGNLIGANIVLFLMVIPLLAITGKAIKINRELQGYNLVFPLVVVSMPVILSLDGRVSRLDGVIAVLLFVISSMVIQRRRRLEDNVKTLSRLRNMSVRTELAKIVFGALLIFGASRVVVIETEFFSQALGLSPFFISLMIIAIGTNLPELSFVVRSMFMKSNQVAFGDYVGSASFNAFLFGLLTLWYGKPILLNNSYMVSLLFLIVGLVLFYFFAKSKNTISRMEASLLLGLYILFFTTEFLLHLPS